MPILDLIIVHRTVWYITFQCAMMWYDAISNIAVVLYNGKLIHQIGINELHCCVMLSCPVLSCLCLCPLYSAHPCFVSSRLYCMMLHLNIVCKPRRITMLLYGQLDCTVCILHCAVLYCSVIYQFRHREAVSGWVGGRSGRTISEFRNDSIRPSTRHEMIWPRHKITPNFIP